MYTKKKTRKTRDFSETAVYETITRKTNRARELSEEKEKLESGLEYLDDIL